MSGIRAWRVPLWHRELPYGSPGFLAASRVARQLPDPVRVFSLAGRVVSRPALIRVVIGVQRLPLVELQALRVDVDAWDGSYFSPPRGNRRAQAVLDLPAGEGLYLRGRPRQALRTNLRRAREIGVTSDRLPGYGEWFEAMSAILRARGGAGPVDWERHKPASGQRVAYYVARDAEETPLAGARVALFGSFGVLFWMMSRSDLQPAASWARYQLHTHLVLDLRSSGHEYLVSGSAFKEPPGTQYFQHLLGYRARNLRVKIE